MHIVLSLNRSRYPVTVLCPEAVALAGTQSEKKNMSHQGRKEESKKMKQGFDDIMARVKKCAKKTVSVSVAQDSAVLEAVKEAKARGIADAKIGRAHV